MIYGIKRLMGFNSIILIPDTRTTTGEKHGFEKDLKVSRNEITEI